MWMGEPLPWSRFSLPDRGGDAGGDRIDGPMLIARPLGSFRGAYCVGRLGNGGTLTGPELVAGRWGDCSRKVRAVIELLLLERRSVPLTLAERRPPTGLTCDWVEARRWTMRFVSTFPTGVGVGVELRSAAAAAAEDRLLVDGCDLRKAWLAADWADCDAGGESGWSERKSCQFHA